LRIALVESLQILIDIFNGEIVITRLIKWVPGARFNS